MMQQQTIGQPVSLSGVGVHTGVEASVTLSPLEAGQGIELIRTDKNNARLPLQPEAVVETVLCTKMANSDGITVQTVEHLFSALHGLGVDNVRIEIDGPEVPILDGSALPWVRLIDEAGLVPQTADKNVFYAPESLVDVSAGQARVTKADALEFALEASFTVPGLARLSGTWTITPEMYRTDIAPARTFCLYKDVERMQQAGLIQGGSLDCAVVFDDDGRPMNPDGLRFADEPLRHKVLDAVGDLFLLGRPVCGRFAIPNPGHGVNNQILRALV